MTRLCIGFHSRVSGVSLPGVLELDPLFGEDLLGAVKLSSDGVLRLSNGYCFKVSAISFTHSYGSKGEGFPEPYMSLGVSTDPILVDIFAKYASVLKFKDVTLVGDSVRGSVDVYWEDEKGMSRAFLLLADVISRGQLCYRSGQSLIVRDLRKDLASTYNKFLEAYIEGYLHSACSFVRVEADKEGGKRCTLSTVFFERFFDGRALLHDEKSTGILSVLLANAHLFPCMKREEYKVFLSAAVDAIGRLNHGLVREVMADEHIANRSFINARAAATISKCYDGGNISEGMLLRIVNDLGSVADGFSRAVKESLDLLSLAQVFSRGSLLSRSMMREIEGILPGFKALNEKHARIMRGKYLRYEKAMRAVEANASISFEEEYEALIDRCGSAGRILGEGFGENFHRVLAKYMRFCSMGMGRGTSWWNAISGKMRFRKTTRNSANMRFSYFCFMSFLQLGKAFVKGENIELQSNIEIDDTVSSIVTHARKRSFLPFRRSRYYGYLKGVAIISSAIVGFSLFLVAVSSLAEVKSLAMGNYYAAVCMLLAIVLLLASAVGVVTHRGISSSKRCDVLLGIRFKDSKQFNAVMREANEQDFCFKERRVYVDGRYLKRNVSEKDCDVFLIERRRCDEMRGKCIFLGMDFHDEQSMLFLKGFIKSVAYNVPGGCFSFGERTSMSSDTSGTRDLFCIFRATTRPLNVQLACLLATVGQPQLLLAYLDSFVSSAEYNDYRLSQDFLEKNEWKLLVIDQSRWGVMEVLREYCGEYITGERRKFIDAIDNTFPMGYPKVNPVEVVKRGVGFPFDSDRYLEVAKLVPGLDISGNEIQKSMGFGILGMLCTNGNKILRSEGGLERAQITSPSITSIFCSVEPDVGADAWGW